MTEPAIYALAGLAAIGIIRLMWREWVNHTNNDGEF